MPAEWAPHEATWLSWPHKLASWPGNFAPVPKLYARLVRTLAEVEHVNVLCGGHARAQAKVLLAGVANVTLHDIETDDAWVRDFGPTFLVAAPGTPAAAEPALVDWRYNAWGGKYPPYAHDDIAPTLIARRLGRKCFVPGIIMEGGAIDPDGEGTLLTTEECLLNPNRNVDLGREQVEQYLADYLAVRKVLWLGRGIVGDDTDGHIDELARFVAPGVVLAATEDDTSDVNHEPLAENFARLKSMTDAAGRPLTVVPLPLPSPIEYDQQRLPASYCNFYVANELVIVPQFGDARGDDRALGILREHCPQRRVVGLPARELVWGLGAFHCITQQQPRLWWATDCSVVLDLLAFAARIARHAGARLRRARSNGRRIELHG